MIVMTIDKLAGLLELHRVRYDSLSQDNDSWYCECNGYRAYRTREQAVREHLAPAIWRGMVA